MKPWKYFLLHENVKHLKNKTTQNSLNIQSTRVKTTVFCIMNAICNMTFILNQQFRCSIFLLIFTIYILSSSPQKRSTEVAHVSSKTNVLIGLPPFCPQPTCTFPLIWALCLDPFVATLFTVRFWMVYELFCSVESHGNCVLNVLRLWGHCDHFWTLVLSKWAHEKHDLSKC